MNLSYFGLIQFTVQRLINLLSVIITDYPKTVLSLRFHLFYGRCCSIFTCFTDLFLVGYVKNDLVKYFMQHIHTGLIIDMINS